jgi:hypothetical protein
MILVDEQMLDAGRSSVTFVCIYETTRRHIPYDSTLHIVNISL